MSVKPPNPNLGVIAPISSPMIGQNFNVSGFSGTLQPGGINAPGGKNDPVTGGIAATLGTNPNAPGGANPGSPAAGSQPTTMAAVQGSSQPNAQWAQFFALIAQRASQTPPWIEDTHANRANYNPSNFTSSPVSYPVSGASNLQPNTEGGLYYETDTMLFYRSVMVSNVATWVYFSGTYVNTIANIPTGLTAADNGLLFYVTDYNHTLQWNGAGSHWQWGPGELGSGMMVLFEVDPTGVGWQLYDGGTYNYLKADGTTASITLPNLSGAGNTPCFLEADATDNGPNAPVAPTISGGGGNTGSAVTGISNPSNTGSTTPGPTGGPSATVEVATSVLTTFVATATHTHTEAAHLHTIGAPTDPGHVHSLGSLTAGTNGTPESINRRAFFRI